jgi:hypothetical protein
MRLAFATALITLALCSQGCLSFFALGSPHTERGKARKRSCIVTGVLSTAFMVAGTALMAQGFRDSQKHHDSVEGLDQSMADGGILTASLGLILEVPGIILGFVSISHGIASARDARPERYYETGAFRRGRVDRCVVGLPGLNRMGPRELPIQRSRWFWAEED